MRIALIHALKHSAEPITTAFAKAWPAPELMHLLDDSLSRDLARDGALTEAMVARFLTLGRYARSTGADAILFTCSAFGPAIEAVARDNPDIPVLKPNEAMIDDAVARANGGAIGLLATFGPTLASMPREFPQGTKIVPVLAEGALAALDQGNAVLHDQLAVAAAEQLILDPSVTVLALAQFSLARSAATIATATATAKPVLTTPDSAVARLKRLLA